MAESTTRSTVRWGLRRRAARGCLVLLASLLTTAGSAALAPAAHADVSSVTPRLTQAWTDSARPRTSLHDGAPQVGTRIDGAGVAHTSRTYVTFDLAAMRGRSVSSAYFTLASASGACDGLPDVEVRSTATPMGPVTWAGAPAQRRLAGTVTSASPVCPGAYAEVPATTLVQQALAARASALSIVVRVPADHETDPAYLAQLATDGVRLLIASDGAPSVDSSSQTVDGQSCSRTAATWVTSRTPLLGATLSDPEPDWLDQEWAVWPVAHPSRRTVIPYFGPATSTTLVRVPDGTLAHDGVYAFSVRAGDGTLTSPWSRPCRFTVDTVHPLAPTVTAPSLDATGTAPIGRPITFDFTATSPDVPWFEFSWSTDFPSSFPPDPATSVRPRHLGGTARVRLSLPSGPPFATLHVRSVDRAGNPSETASIDVRQPSSAATVTLAGGIPTPGGTVQVAFAPHDGLRPVTSYRYTVAYGAERTVAAGPDGTALVTIALPDDEGMIRVSASSVSTNGFVSQAGSLDLDSSTRPWVTSSVYPQDAEGGGVGVTGTFVVTNRDPAATELEYSFDFGTTTVRVPIVDGRATITYTPTEAGYQALTVDTVGPDGPSGWPTYYNFLVAG